MCENSKLVVTGLVVEFGEQNTSCSITTYFHENHYYLWLTINQSGYLFGKVEKSGFNPITFTFSENSNFWRESLLEIIRQNTVGWWQQTFCLQKFVDKAKQCFAITHQVNFCANNLNFHWRWWDWIQAILNI